MRICPFARLSGPKWSKCAFVFLLSFKAFEATLLSGLRRKDEELSLLDMHTWQGGTDAWLDQVGLLLSWWDG